GIKKLQADWIGRSTGAEVDFFIGDGGQATPDADAFDAWKQSRAASGFPDTPDTDTLRVYTTRPDTLYGATYMVVAPEHPLIDQLTTADQADAVRQYRTAASFKSERERTGDDSNKTGVFTGSYARNPAGGAAIPIWTADYVLASYGTGAIMAVPAHDTRDFDFATAFEIPITCVVSPPADVKKVKGRTLDHDAVLRGRACFVGTGIAVNSGPYDGQHTDEIKPAITQSLSQQGLGSGAVNFKLRDWLFSRQRFWGEPFPILHAVNETGQRTGRKIPVPVDQLPVCLPDLQDYKPHGRPEPLLAKADDDWMFVTIDGQRYARETNTMPQWAGSCWYYLRYIDPHNADALVDPDKERAWMPVDLYVGGAEHAVLHLLYARFWHKVLYDRGHVSTPEPFHRLVNQGMILGEVEYTGYQSSDGNWISSKQVPKSPTELQAAGITAVSIDENDLDKVGDKFVLQVDPSIAVDSKAAKMSKSRGNVVNPDEIVRDYGADSLRLYEMFMGPLEATKPWSMSGVGGVRNFLDRAWRMIVD
ncbi:MAG: class I tRNA ligase family protein, partial [Planctomycetota bacterium]